MFKFISNLNHLINPLDIGSVVLCPPELGFDKTNHRIFPHKIGVFFFIWSVVGVFHLVGGRCFSFGRWSVVGVFHLVGGRCFSFGRWPVFFIWSVASVCHLVGGRLCIWSVVDGFYIRCDQWSVSISVGGRCFMFLMVGGRFFRQWSVVCVLSSIWSVVDGTRSVVNGTRSVVDGTRSVVGGQWSVVGGWSVGGGFVLRLVRCSFLQVELMYPDQEKALRAFLKEVIFSSVRTESISCPSSDLNKNTISLQNWKQANSCWF